MVDADFAEFIHNHGHAAAVVGRQYSIQQSRLAGAEKSGEHGDRHSLIVSFAHTLEILP